MANFCYKAISAKGKTVRGLVEADTERQAIASVREKGLVPLSVESASASVANPGMPSSKSSFKKILESLHPVPKTAVAAMARQLATLLHAGLPLDEALASICAHDDASRMQGIVSRLRDRIMAGGDLADGLAEFPNVFSSTFVTMVRAGEASGTLELVIERFAEHIEQQVALVRKVQATLAYPILMLFVGIGVGLIVRQGGSSGGDDALALVISKVAKCRLSFAYLFTDLTVLALSLSYIPLNRILFSVVTVTLSSFLIDQVQNFSLRRPEKA